MARWLLARHGETEWNASGRLQGNVAVALSEAGRQQARALRERLAATPIEVAYSSDLPRAVETAEIISEGRPSLEGLHLCPELRELSYGRWEGLSLDEVQASDPDGLAALLRAEPDFAPPDGESLRALTQRIGAFADMARQSPAATLLIVAHSGPLRALILELLGLPLTSFWQLHLSAASLSIVEVHPVGSVLELLNDTSHYRRVP